MAVATLGELKAPNYKIMNNIRDGASLEYRNRIPAATQANIKDTAATLFKFRPLWNEFIDGLVNRIGEVVVQHKTWTNPMAEFKGGLFEFGDTIEEVQVGLIEAKVYDPDREYLAKEIFGTTRPDVQANFHTVNRQNYYPITVNEDLLKRAFLEAGGLSKFITALLDAPITSDNLDEYKIMTGMFRTYETMGGFHHVNVADVGAIGSTAEQARGLLRAVRAYTETLKFISTDYNASGMPTHSQPDDLILFTTPDVKAAIDVEALAAAFNVSMADVQTRIVTIPKKDFRIKGVQAILVDKSFFIVRDTLIQNTNANNPVGLQQNYFLHHWQIISFSRFANAVMFWDGPSDVIEETDDETPKSISTPTITDVNGETVAANGDVKRGFIYQMAATVTTDPETETDQPIIWSVEGALSSRTHVTEYGVLHVGWDEGASTLKIVASSGGYDPENLRAKPVTSNVSVKVTGEVGIKWPVAGEAAYITVGDDVRIDLVAGTTAYNLPSTWTEWSEDTLRTLTVHSRGPVGVSLSATGKVLTVSVTPSYGAAATDFKITLVAPTA